jgi:Flp pilus assembly protein TadG
MTPARLRNDESGAILIYVAIAILVLTALSAFVLDYGVMWMSRREAQNAADAGALAGAVARAYDETTDPPAAGGVAEQAAAQAATANLVFQSVPGAVVTWDCPSYVAGTGCVRVDVHRDGTNGSATLPTYFAPLFGISTQATLATATAQAAVANASDCLRPFAIPDKWVELNPTAGTWSSTSVFNRYQMTGKNKGTVLTPADTYTPPTDSGPGSGFTIAADYGSAVTLKFGNPNGSDPISPGWFLPVDIPRAEGPSTGGDRYRENIASCAGLRTAIGDYIPTETGAKIGPTKQGIGLLIAQDPNATWNTTTKTVDNSCAPGCAAQSPRIIALPVFNPDTFQYSNATNNWTACPGGGTCVRIVNILGFFVQSISGSGDVSGYLVNVPGELESGSPSLSGASSFSKVITLVR